MGLQIAGHPCASFATFRNQLCAGGGGAESISRGNYGEDAIRRSVPNDRGKHAKMSRPLRIAMFVGSFPVVSETFILRQITGLLDLGYEVDIFANAREEGALIHPDVTKYRLLERATYVDGPAESIFWELPIWPLSGRTWPPGSQNSIPNAVRLLRAVPQMFRCLASAPR